MGLVRRDDGIRMHREPQPSGEPAAVSSRRPMKYGSTAGAIPVRQLAGDALTAVRTDR